MSRGSQISGVAGKVLFVLGFLWTGVVGTAPGVPFHGVGLALCALGVLFLLAASAFSGRWPEAGVLPVVVAVALMWFAVRAAFSPVQHLAELDLMLVGAVAMGFGAAWFSGGVRWILPWLWLLAVAAVWFSVLQVRGDDSGSLLSPLGIQRPIRSNFASGFFYHSNPYGAWSAMVLLLALCIAIHQRGFGLNRLGALLAAAAAAFGLMFSFSRAAFGGFGLGLGVVVLASIVVVSRWRVSTARKAWLGVLVLLLLGAVGYGAAQWLPVLAERRTGEVATLESFALDPEVRERSRGGYWRTGLSQFLEAPVIGTGSRTFSYMSYKHWDEAVRSYDHDIEFVHNEYIQSAAEYGLVGLVLIAGVAVLAVVRSFLVAARLSRRDSTRRGRAEVAWALGVLGAGVALLGDAVFSFSAHFAPIALLLGVMLGGLSVAGRGGMVRGGEDGRGFGAVFPTLPMLVVVFGSAIFLLATGLNYGRAAVHLYWQRAEVVSGRAEFADYLQSVRSEARRLPRHPMLEHLAEVLIEQAGASGLDPDEREKLLREAEGILDAAVEAFPYGVSTRLLRARVRHQLHDDAGSDEDFRFASEWGEKREFFYRIWMKWGEVRYERALRAWGEGRMGDASRHLQDALEAYVASTTLTWVPRDYARYYEGRKRVEDAIELFKRTNEWRE